MREKLTSLVDRWASRLDIISYVCIGMSVVSGYLTAHFAALNRWIASFGPIGYWTAGLLGALIVALIGGLIARIRLWWITGKAIDKWKEETSTVNPLDHEFTNVRINIADLVNPVTRRISKKRFVNCELMGPATIVFLGQGSVTGSGFINCDLLCVREDRPAFNAVILENIEMLGCRLYACTIYVPRAFVPSFADISGVFFINYTGDPAVDNLPPPKFTPNGPIV